MKNKIYKQQAGFTLIELLVSIVIIGFVMVMGLSALVSTLRSSTKTTIYNHVKQNGDLAMETITRSVRNAVDVCTTTSPRQIMTYASSAFDCNPPPPFPILRFRCTEGVGSNGSLTKRVEDGSGNVLEPETAIVSDVLVASCNFAVSCAPGQGCTVPKRVTIDFTLAQDVSLGNSSDVTATIPFHTEVTLRNF